MACSAGIMAYNEEANIADAIGTILGQELHASHVAELIVVASGCEDGTVAIVSDIAGHDPRVRLIEQPQREGKASAINLFLGAATAPVLLMVSADVLVEDGTIDALLRSGAFMSPRGAVWSIGTVALEATARGLGHYDVMRRRPQHVWEMCATTKEHVADGATEQAQQNVLVFHIVDFNRYQLELGGQVTRQMTHRVRDHVKRAVGSKAIVSIRQSGTIVALVDGEREAAQRTAAEIVEHFEADPSVTLACGIIAFPGFGPCVAQSIRVGMLAAEPATAVAS